MRSKQKNARYIFFFVGMAVVVAIPWATPYLLRDFSRKAQERADASTEARLHKETDGQSAVLKNDRIDGFTKIDGGMSGVAVYRDNKSGCEWVAFPGSAAVLRTSPDQKGVMRPVCPPVAVTGPGAQ